MQVAEFGWALHRDTYGSAEEGVYRVDPQNLRLEDYAKVAGDGLGYEVEVLFAAQFFLHGGYGPGRDAAGDNQIEVAEIRVYVQSEAMRSHEAGDVDADGG